MKDLETIKFHDATEKITEILCNKTQSNVPQFFRVMVSYYLAKVTSMMRVDILQEGRGIIPVNVYAIALAPSGYGKGHSTNIIEDKVINLFKQRYLDSTFPILAEANLEKIAQKRANNNPDSTLDDELAAVNKEFDNLGELLFSFDSATTAAVKQMRHKLLMANAGSMNMEIDEIGSNMSGNTDVLTTLLELYDVGKVKPKLVKNTSDNIRNKDIDGRTPTNLLLFGTQSKLFDGGRVEDEFITFLETGYGRRCLFGFVRNTTQTVDLTPEQEYALLTDTSSTQYLEDFAVKLSKLADPINFGKQLKLGKAENLLLLEYKQQCAKLANLLPEHEGIRKAELIHRAFKVLKLAGTYAFIDGCNEIDEDCLYSAIKLVEESGKAFNEMMTRDRNYVKLAKYIAAVGQEITLADLQSDLPFYKGSEAQKREMLTLAIAHGYKNNIIIKKYHTDGIDFLKGESLGETDINKLSLSYSTKLAEGYKPAVVKFKELPKLFQSNGFHWASHAFLDQHRNEENAIVGFNMVVLDVDDSVSMSTVELLLKDYTYTLYTTKRHTKEQNRFRVVLPMSHTLKLDAKDFKEFMNNIYEWLPFEVDEGTNQRSKKWLSHAGTCKQNEGELLNSLLFIPKTTKNDERKRVIDSQQALSNVERWFINNTAAGNRNQQLVKFAFMLVDSGMSIDSVRNNVLALNNKIPNPVPESEIHSTIMISAAKAIVEKATK